MSESRYRYVHAEATKYKDGDNVTVTMSNGCRANGKIQLAGDDGKWGGSRKGGSGESYGNSTMRDVDTAEVVYKVKILSGPNRGMILPYNESQIQGGHHADALGNTCDSGDPVYQSVTKTSSEEAASGSGSVTAALVAIGVLALIAWAARGSGSGSQPQPA